MTYYHRLSKGPLLVQGRIYFTAFYANFSANALLALGLQKLYISINDYSLESLYPIINSDNYVGLLSSGVVTIDGEIIALDKALQMK